MAHENPKSPNAIPPRSSSYGLNGVPQKSVLRPLSEIHWMSSGKKHQHTTSNPPFTSPALPRGTNEGSRGSWTAEQEKILLGPYEYLATHPGKEIRSQMISAFDEWLKVPPESLAVITKVVGMLHTASLLVDDVEDSSILRRGIPVANNIFGTAQTINSANYVYFLALGELQKLRSSNAIEIYTEELINLHRGQGMDLYWRDSLTCPTEAEYLEMVNNKTGGLFRLAIKLMQAESSSNLDCLPLVNIFGLLFQILDDHLNLSAYRSTKGLCEDLTEGKFSFPIIHAIRADDQNLVLMNILRQKTKDEEVKRFAVSYMERMGSFEHSKDSINDLKERAFKIIADLEKHAGGETGSSAIRAIINDLRVP